MRVIDYIRRLVPPPPPDQVDVDTRRREIAEAEYMAGLNQGSKVLRVTGRRWDRDRKAWVRK